MIVAGILAATGMLAYANSFAAPFAFDFNLNDVEQNPAIHRLWPPWAPMRNTMRPVGWWTFAVNYAAGGTAVWGYHAVNLAIHLAAALTLYGIVRRSLLGGRLAVRFGAAAPRLALAVSLLWLVHPLQTQSVTYIYQRFESLMGLFLLLTLYSFIRAHDSARRTVWYGATVVCCLLAVMTKEVAVAAPLLVLWYDRVFVVDSWRDLWRRRWALYAALAATWVPLAALMRSQGDMLRKAGVLVVKGVTPLQYALSQPGVIAHYLRLSVWPVGLCLDDAWPVADTAAKIIPPLVLVASLLALTVWATRRSPAWSFLGGWFFLILAPTSSIVPIVDLAFEHRMYLPLAALVTGAVIGGYLCGAWLLARPGRVAARWPHLPLLIGYGLTGAIALTLALMTVRRNLDYRSAVSIWADTLRKSPHNPRAHNNLALALAERGEIDEAIAHYREALRIKPDYALANNNLGMTLVNRGQVDEAIALYRKALEVDSDDAELHFNLATTLADRGEVDDAIAHYRKAVEISPDYAAAHNNLGLILGGRGQVDEAIGHFRKALEVNPDFADALNNLAWILATSPVAARRDGATAVALAARAVRLSNGQDMGTLDTLAAAYAEAGRFPEAAQTARRAVALAEQQNQQTLIAPIQAKIRLYEAGKPFRDIQVQDGGQR